MAISGFPLLELFNCPISLPAVSCFDGTDLLSDIAWVFTGSDLRFAILLPRFHDANVKFKAPLASIRGRCLGHCLDIWVGSGDHHCVVRSIQLSSLRTFYPGCSTERCEQDRSRAQSIRAAPTGRMDAAAVRLSQARRPEAYI